MTIQRQLLNRAAICTTTMVDNNTFKIPPEDMNASNIEVGDKLHVAVTRADLGTDFGPDDRAIFQTTVGPEGLMIVPSKVTNKLDLNSEDPIKYVAIPDKSVPGIQNGPIRERINGEEAEEIDRPEREALEDSYQGPKMRQTGQIKVPGDVLDRLGLIQGDDVALIVEYEGEEISQKGTVGTQSRVTIKKETREKLGLESGDKPRISIQVLD